MGNTDSDVLYTELAKKFAVMTTLFEYEASELITTQTPPSSSVAENTQRLMKRRALASQDSKGTEKRNDDAKDAAKNIKRKHHTLL